MKKIVVAFLLFSCNNDKTKISAVKENELKQNFTERLKEYDSTAKVDSFRFIKLDTITLKTMYGSLSGEIIEGLHKDGRVFDAVMPIYKSKRNLLRLSAGLSGSLYQNYKSEADDEWKKVEEVVLNDSLLQNDLDTIKIRIQRADSVKVELYEAVCLYQYKRKDMSVKKDTTYIFLNKEMNIISKDDYKKMLFKLFKPTGNPDIKYD